MSPVSRKSALVALVAIAVAACSQGSSDAVHYDPFAIADAAVIAADDDALAAAGMIVVALDRGYRFEAVVEALDAGLFDGSVGTIRDDSGALVEPSDADSGVISDKPPLRGALAEGSFGGMGLARSADNRVGDVLLDTLLDSIGNSFGQLNFGATTAEELLAQPEPALPPAWNDSGSERVRNHLALMAILGLAASGYSAEQIVWIAVGGDRIQCNNLDAQFGDAKPCHVEGETPDLAASDIFAQAAPEKGADDNRGESGDAALYVGQADGRVGPSGDVEETFINSVEAEAGETLTGTVDVVQQLGLDGLSWCHYASGVIVDLPLTDPATGTYSGSMEMQSYHDAAGEPCAPGTDPHTGDPARWDVTVVVDGNTMTGTFAPGGTFTATRR